MTMMDFDAARAKRNQDRSFKIGGETFSILPVQPEVLLAHQDLPSNPADMLPQMDKLILALIDPEDSAHARYKKIRSRKKDPLTLGDVSALMTWLIGRQSQDLEVETGLPTGAPSISIPGPMRIGAPSTVDSSSPASPAVRAV